MRHHIRHHTGRLVPAALVALVALLASAIGAGAATPQHAVAGPLRGGTIAIAYSDDMVTFDPQLAYSDDWAVLNGTLFNGLYQFDRGGTPRLDLAAGPPTISPDHKVWTFHIRKGVRFSNGMEVTADDFKYSITRALDPNLKPYVSWGQPFDEIFQGSQDFVAGKARAVPGIQALGRYTIRFVLSQPVAILPYILASSYNFVVPRALVSKEAPSYFGNHPVGTGPFMLQAWQKGTKVVFVRNPSYFRVGKPYADKVIVYVNVAPSVIALKVEKGELTGFGAASQLTPADLQQARSDPRYAGYLLPAATTTVDRLNLDVHVAPLDKLIFRQAIALAIDRARLVKLLGGMAIPATQIYVPLDPQFDPALAMHPIYPYNPRRAAALLKASGYHGQPITVFYYNNLPDWTSMAPGIQQDLKQIGLNVTLRGVSHNSGLAIFAKLTGHQISPTLWSVDFFDGYDVYSGALSCGANGVGGEGAHYCDPVADDLANKAEGLPLGPARDALLRQAQARILRGAAEVPLVFLKNVEMVSPKLGGFYYHAIFGWQYENYWLKP